MKKLWTAIQHHADLIGCFVLAVLLFGACFHVGFIWAAAVGIIVFAILLRQKNKVLGLIFFTDCFYILFNAVTLPLGGGVLGTWTLFDLVLCALKLLALGLFLCPVIKQKRKLGWSILFPVGLLILYLLLPMHEFSVKDLIAVGLTLLLLYVVCTEYKEINLNYVVRVFVWGLVLSCFYGLLGHKAPVLAENLAFATLGGKVRLQGLTVSASYLALLIVLVICALLISKYKKRLPFHKFYVVFIPLVIFGYLTLSNIFIITVAVALAIFVIFYLRQYRIRVSAFVCLSLIIIGTVMMIFFDASKIIFTSFGNQNENLVAESKLLLQTIWPQSFIEIVLLFCCVVASWLMRLSNEAKQQIVQKTYPIDDGVKTIKLSIIIPVYNGEKFINHCIDRVLQIPLNKEIIVINDASSDRSLELLQAYGKRIILINLEKNHGVSHARNLGLAKATGDYITFIDQDDDFELDMHAKILTEMIQNDADVGICDFDMVETDGTVKPSGYDIVGDLPQDSVISLYLRQKLAPVLWTSVYRASLAKSVHFAEGLGFYGEDRLYQLRILLHAQKTCFVNDALYRYLEHASSGTHVITDWKKFQNHWNTPDYLPDAEKQILEDKFREEFAWFHAAAVRVFVHDISLSKKYQRKEAKQLLQKVLTKEICQAQIKNPCGYFWPDKIVFFNLKTFGVGFHLWIHPFYVLIDKILND